MKSLFILPIGPKIRAEVEVENVIVSMPRVVQRGIAYKAVCTDAQVQLTKQGPRMVVHWRIVGKQGQAPTVQHKLTRVK
jgi:hypothetical protein